MVHEDHGAEAVGNDGIAAHAKSSGDDEDIAVAVETWDTGEA